MALTPPLDPRIDVVATSGYFRSRQRVWEEPIYRNVWGLPTNSAMRNWRRWCAAPLIVEACLCRTLVRPRRAGRGPAQAPGRIDTPPLDEVECELARASRNCVPWAVLTEPFTVVATSGRGLPGSSQALKCFWRWLRRLVWPRIDSGTAAASGPQRASGDSPNVRLKRQFDELIDYTQKLVEESPYTREQVLAQADRASGDTAKWQQTTKPLSRIFL